MNRLPWFPFYHFDFETSPRVKQMGPAARCYYLTLLSHQWQEGHIPTDRDEIKRLLVMPQDIGGAIDVEATLDIVLKCFEPIANGSQVNRKMEIVRKEHAKIHRQRSDAGRKGNEIRWKDHHKAVSLRDRSAIANASQSESESESDKSVLSFEKRKNQRKAARQQAASCFVLPKWIPRDSWSAYIEMRQRIRKPMTFRAMELACMELERLKAHGDDPGVVLNQSVLHAWQGLFPVRKLASSSVPEFTEEDFRREVQTRENQRAIRRQKLAQNV